MTSVKLLSFVFFLSLSSFALSQNCGDLPSRISTVDFPVETPLEVSDIWPFTGNPTFLRPKSDGGSYVAWGNGRGQAFISKLNSNFQRVGNPITVPYEHCRDVVETPDGGLAYIGVRDNPVTHDAAGKFCKDPIKNPQGAWCARVDVVKLAADGSQQWSTQLTNDKVVDTVGSHFIWWYGNFMRLAYGNGIFAIYYQGTGGSLNTFNNQIEFHQGDAGRFIDSNGRLLDSNFNKCAHSSDVRIAYNPNSKKFGAFCFSDNTDIGFHLTITDPSGRKDVTVFKSSTANVKFGKMGAIVPDTDGSGFWVIYSYPEFDDVNSPCNIQLSHITGAGVIDNTVPLATLPGVDENRPYLALYGPKKDSMLAGWSVRDKFVITQLHLNGQIISKAEIPKPILPIGRDWVTLTNGDVAWVWKKDDKTLQITKVAGCGPFDQVRSTDKPITAPPFCPEFPAKDLVSEYKFIGGVFRDTFSWTAPPATVRCAVYITNGKKWLTPIAVQCRDKCSVQDTVNTYDNDHYWFTVSCFTNCRKRWSPWSALVQFRYLTI